MKKPKFDLRPEMLRVPLGLAVSVSGGFLFSMGTISGAVSPLAAALAGIVPPLYSISILLGSLLCYGVTGAPPEMHFLLTALVLVTCLRVLFRELNKPHILALMTASCGILGGFVLDFLFYGGAGNLPLYIFESLLTGVAVYFLADAAAALRESRRIVLHAGKTFTFALCYLLCVTALCGIDTPLCNIGRIAGMSLTLLFAKQMRYTGGTLLGALTACGVTLCSVSLGTPVLFLPVTAMMAGFCANLPNALLIPLFFVLQGLSSAVLDSSIGFVKVMVELAFSCGIFALCSQLDLHRFLVMDAMQGTTPRLRQERYLSEALHSLRDETSAVMHRLTVAPPEDAVMQVRDRLCTGCKNQSYCWVQRAGQTAPAIRELLHTHRRATVPEAIDGCIRRTTLLEVCAEQSSRSALSQMQRVHLLQSRKVTLEHLQILGEVTEALAAMKEQSCLLPQTQALRRILCQCACEGEAQVYKLRSGRIAAEVLTRQPEFPASSVRTLLSKYLAVPLSMTEIPCEDGASRICLYQTPSYCLEWSMQSRNAPDYERCGDHCDAFADCIGDQYLVLSDGMGSGSTASLASRIAVRTFRRMVQGGMAVSIAIRLVNSMLLTETNTENFATLDVLHFHSDSGELTLYKSGAAATLFCHAGQVQRISSMSFPVGIVTDALPSRRHTTAYEGDTIVMLSDGIGEAEYPYISQLLRAETTPVDLVRAATGESGVFHGGQPRDDVTVIAARVLSQFPSQFTKNSSEENRKCVGNAPEYAKTL